MTTGEKIKYYRNMRGLSQETLGKLSGIHTSTIKKYELNILNPKPKQLLKIADALGISINVFTDFDITTVSDVLALVFKMDEEIDLNFEADKDENGIIIPSTIKLSFSHPAINAKLSSYLKTKQLQERLENDAERYVTDEKQLKEMLNEISESMGDLKKYLLSDSIVVKKGTTGITVKIPPQLHD